VYGAVYALSSGRMAFEAFPPFDEATWLKVLALRRADSVPNELLVLLGFAAAYSPNPNKSPFFVDLPFEVSGTGVRRVDSVWAKWVEHDPLTVVQRHTQSLRNLRAMYLDCGTSDDLIGANRQLSQLLTQLGIPHVFQEYDGDHTGRIRERLERNVLPMFSRVLLFQ
jgi:hypothetical protein